MESFHWSYSTQKHIKCPWKAGWWRRRCPSHLFLKFTLLLLHVNRRKNDRLNFYVYRLQMINVSLLVIRHRMVYRLEQSFVVTIVWERERSRRRWERGRKNSSFIRFFWSSTRHVFFISVNLTSDDDLLPFFWLSFTNINSHTDMISFEETMMIWFSPKDHSSLTESHEDVLFLTFLPRKNNLLNTQLSPSFIHKQLWITSPCPNHH